MSTTTTTKPINLDQLTTELGGAGLSMSDDGSERTITTDQVDQATLDSAVTAHVAIDEQGNENTIRDQALTALQTNRDFLAIASPTNAQTLAEVKALARQANGLIRLALDKFDGTN